MLTPKQWREREMRVLNVLELSLNATFEIPTLSQMSTQLGLSKSTVHKTLMQMQCDGLIEWDKHQTGTIAVTWDVGDKLYERAKLEHLRELGDEHEKQKS